MTGRCFGIGSLHGVVSRASHACGLRHTILTRMPREDGTATAGIRLRCHCRVVATLGSASWHGVHNAYMVH